MRSAEGGRRCHHRTEPRGRDLPTAATGVCGDNDGDAECYEYEDAGQPGDSARSMVGTPHSAVIGTPVATCNAWGS